MKIVLIIACVVVCTLAAPPKRQAGELIATEDAVRAALQLANCDGLLISHRHDPDHGRSACLSCCSSHFSSHGVLDEAKRAACDGTCHLAG
ncbi:hypothetical protein BaRGS_00018952 [Batillaria attramentaria]|uniref:Uncharacterized protein n=1 Tax=Batillaria attramentaria TaxID=370345 RepID=A0ABD0KRM9_9CAEN